MALMGFLSRLLRPRASLENPRYTLNDPEAWDYLGASPTSSGVRVNRESALHYGPWWRGIVLISSTVGKLPLHVLKREGDGKVRDPRHQAYRLLRRKPNGYQTAFVFRQQLTGHAVSTGNGYAYIHRDRLARPLELWPLDPDRVIPVLADGEAWYHFELPDGTPRKLPGTDVLHIRGFNFDGLTGYSVWDLAREDLGTSMAQREYRGKLYASGARPGVVLETPQKLTKPAADELRAAWERIHAGLDNSHRTAVLHSGVQAKVVSMDPKDTELNASEKFSIVQIANFLGLPPHKLGDASRTAYNSLEQENQSCIDDGYDPWLVNWEEQCADKLLTEDEKDNDTHVVEFVREALVRGDLAARAAYYTKALGGKSWMVVNEVRGRENLNPVEGGDALDDPTPAPPPLPPEDDDQDDVEDPDPDDTNDADDSRDTRNKRLHQAARAVLDDAAGRMTRRLAHAAERAARDPRTYLDWVERMHLDHRPVIAEAFAPAAELLAALDLPTSAADLAHNFVAAAQRELSALADTCTAKDLPAAAARLSLPVADVLPVAEVVRLQPSAS